MDEPNEELPDGVTAKHLETMARGKPVDMEVFHKVVTDPGALRNLMGLKRVHGLFAPANPEDRFDEVAFQPLEGFDFSFSDLDAFLADMPVDEQTRERVRDFLLRAKLNVDQKKPDKGSADRR